LRLQSATQLEAGPLSNASTDRYLECAAWMKKLGRVVVSGKTDRGRRIARSRPAAA
jgi:hypothetical protein